MTERGDSAPGPEFPSPRAPVGVCKSSKKTLRMLPTIHIPRSNNSSKSSFIGADGCCGAHSLRDRNTGIPAWAFVCRLCCFTVVLKDRVMISMLFQPSLHSSHARGKRTWSMKLHPSALIMPRIAKPSVVKLFCVVVNRVHF